VGKFGTGQAIRRVEDQRFLTGHGQYTGDISIDGQAHLYLFRSPFAHGSISHLDVSEARQSPGVVAVFTSRDLTDAGVMDLPGFDMPASPLAEGKDALTQPPLARDRVRYVGEPVAGIVAESLAIANDAAELIEFDVEETGAAANIANALADGAETIHTDVPGNLLGVLSHGDKQATDAIFDKAAHVVSVDIVNNRLAPTAMEPRACVVDVDPASEKITLYQGCQGVHTLKAWILKSIDIAPEMLHVISPDVGGAFGLKSFLQCETIVALYAAMTLDRPIKWVADRTESFLSDLHGRDHLSHAELAVDDDGRFLALRASITGNAGAYCSQVGPIIPWFGASMAPGCYGIPTGYLEIGTAMSNTAPLDAYRGAGRPEATYLIERLVDQAARELNMGRDEIRRRNFILPESFPYTTFTGRVYDSGEYARLLEKALSRADWAGFEDRRELSAGDSKLRGIGLCYYVEICAALGGENTYINFEKDGRVTILMGTQSSGQGHETSFAQMVAAGLGIDMDQIDVIQGDSQRIPTGEGTGGSRSMVIGGSALYRTVNSLIESGSRMAAEVLEAAEADIEFSDGQYRIAGTDRTASLAKVAIASFDDALRPDGVEPGLASEERFAPEGGTFPNGCHVCEVEIDPDTGDVDIIAYTIEDDVGTVVNPLILEGQIVGGAAQGLGQALCEEAIYDPESGQLLTATFMDYTMPRADWIPDVAFEYQEIESPRNPLGIKGAGEAGTIGAAPALVSAVLDALSPVGIEHIDMPTTPHKIWQLLQVASNRQVDKGK
jgi:carbon-monoxide dehydrogenase large subunit